ncbi:MAG: SPOR domain-containing protein [Ignavibacterium sp.]|nr:SPOR domain-containing protein [Ignavibacterium sp.]MDW8376205.1 SPOR domain-containing protein [Ignavibacteriales bacterium]
MNRNQIEEKLTKILGGLTTDKQIIIDNFVSELYEILKPGQQIKIDDLGYFTKISYRLINSKQFKEDSSSENDFILIFSEKENIDTIEEDQIFWKPIYFEPDFSSKNRLLSLSIGKDFLSEKLINSGQIIPASVDELLNLLDSKIQKLLSTSTVFDKFSEEIPCLKIESEKLERNFTVSTNLTSNLNQDSIKTISELSDSTSDQEIALDIPKDFLNEFDELKIDDNKIEEEQSFLKISDTTSTSDEEISYDTLNQIEYQPSEFDLLKDENSFLEEDKSISEIPEEREQLNFSNTFEKIESQIDEDLSNSESSNLNFEEEEEIIEDDISWDKIISEIKIDEDDFNVEEIIKDEQSLPNQEDDKSDFQSSSEIISEIQEPINEPEIFEKSDDESKNEIIDNIITEIKSEEESDLIAEIENETSNKEDFVDQILDETIENFDKEENSEITEDEEIFNSQDEIVDESELEKVEEELLQKSEVTESIQEEKKTNSAKIIILASVLILIISAALVYYFYPQYFEIIKPKEIVITPSINDKEAVRIERDFLIPITYPYPPAEIQNESLLLNNLNKDTITKIETKTLSSSSEIKSVEEKKNVPSIQEVEKKDLRNQTTERSEKISETISIVNGVIIVQVASFKSEVIANREVEKLKSKGYSAYVEKADIPNRGSWYRIKVRGFKSVEEGKIFQSKYNKGEI